MTEDKTPLPSKAEVKKKAGLFWTMAKSFFKVTFKGLFRLIVPRKWDKQHITISLITIAALVLIFVLIINPVISIVKWIIIIVAVVAIIGGVYMVFSGKNPMQKN